MSTTVKTEKTVSQKSPSSKSSRRSRSKRRSSNQTVITTTRTYTPRRRFWRRRRFSKPQPTFNTTENTQQSRVERFVQEFPITTNSSGGYDSAILFCPVKWNNSRVGYLTSLYQGWRPKRVRLTYVPYSATVNTGSITVGTVWNGDRFYAGDDKAYYVSCLVQTPGSFSTSIYQKHSSNIACGTQLRANIFPTTQINEDEIPFTILVYADTNVQNTIIGKLVVSGEIYMRGATVGGAPPAAFSGNVTLTHTADPNETTFTIPLDNLSTQAIGTDYKFQAAAPLTTAQGAVVLRRLSTFIAKIKSIANGIATMTVDSSFPSATFPVNLLGLSTNFWT